MKTLSSGYGLFFDFIDEYLPSGFQNIDPGSPLMTHLEKRMEAHNQFFYIGNLIRMQVLFASKKSMDLIGTEPKNVDPSSFINTVHPNDLHRLTLARTKLFNLGGELFVAKRGIKVISTTLRYKGSSGTYINQLIQCYLFYQGEPFSTVFIFQVNTDISWFKPSRGGYHYYLGDDLSFFRHPDEKLLMVGNIYSKRELEIIKLIAEGLNSEQIAERLFLSVHTIDTHRRNMLKKSDKASMLELILDLNKKGLL